MNKKFIMENIYLNAQTSFDTAKGIGGLENYKISRYTLFMKKRQIFLPLAKEALSVW
ncbi:MAG TPA: hypothetical protein VK766_10410 [Cytophagaceae bacterium]|jgi:hypothetical protein|nr:hypothetical protein [Cytophagaceae bacterium]